MESDVQPSDIRELDIRESDVRAGEVCGALPDSFDAGLYFIGRIRTPWVERAQCPHRGAQDGPLCRLEIAPPWRAALLGIERRQFVQVLYFMHLARRDILIQARHGRGVLAGTFALRSPVRPNPIASSIARLEAVEPNALVVRGLDCVDFTPLIDIKPQD